MATAWLLYAGYTTVGYVSGGILTGVAALVATTDICIPSLIYRSIFGFPQRR